MLSTISQPFLNNNSKSSSIGNNATFKKSQHDLNKQQHTKYRPQALFAALRSSTSSAINKNTRETTLTPNLNNGHHQLNNTNKYGHSFSSIFN